MKPLKIGYHGKEKVMNEIKYMTFIAMLSDLLESQIWEPGMREDLECQLAYYKTKLMASQEPIRVCE